MKPTLVALIAGALFGVGLMVAKMTDPQVVIGFLDVAGNWRPDLLFVMLGAVLVHLVSYRRIRHRPSPLLRDTFHLPQLASLDRPLLLGAALFGVGWGIAGVCPGPALVGLGSGPAALGFLAALVVGMLLHDRTFLGNWARRNRR